MRTIITMIALIVAASVGFPGAAPIRIFCVGNSITSYGYPSTLGTLLGARYDVSNQGVWGATMLKKGDTPYWTTGSLAWILNSSPDIVIIKLGTNDSKPQNWGAHASEFPADYAAMIDTFTHCASRPVVFICLPCPVFIDVFGITGAVIAQQIVPMVRSIAVQTGSPLIDLNTPFLNHPELFSDGVHPTDQGSDSLAHYVYRALARGPVYKRPVDSLLFAAGPWGNPAGRTVRLDNIGPSPARAKVSVSNTAGWLSIAVALIDSNRQELAHAVDPSKAPAAGGVYIDTVTITTNGNPLQLRYPVTLVKGATNAAPATMGGRLSGAKTVRVFDMRGSLIACPTAASIEPVRFGSKLKAGTYAIKVGNSTSLRIILRSMGSS
jgi:lysophospholipase L1-like esterase